MCERYECVVCSPNELNEWRRPHTYTMAGGWGCLREHLVDVKEVVVRNDAVKNNARTESEWRRKKRIFIRFTFVVRLFVLILSAAWRTHKSLNRWDARETMCCFNSNVIIERKRCRHCRRRHQSLPFSVSSSSSPKSTEFNYNFRTIGNSSNRCFVCLLKLNDVHCAMLSNLIVAAHSLLHTFVSSQKKNFKQFNFRIFFRSEKPVNSHTIHTWIRMVSFKIFIREFGSGEFRWRWGGRFAENVWMSQRFLNDWNIISSRRWILNALAWSRAFSLSSTLTRSPLRICCLALIGGEVIRAPSVHRFRGESEFSRGGECANRNGREQATNGCWMPKQSTVALPLPGHWNRICIHVPPPSTLHTVLFVIL